MFEIGNHVKFKDNTSFYGFHGKIGRIVRKSTTEDAYVVEFNENIQWNNENKNVWDVWKGYLENVVVSINKRIS